MLGIACRILKNQCTLKLRLLDGRGQRRDYNKEPHQPLVVMSSDLNTLLDMGFEQPKAELAVKTAGGRTQHENSAYA